MVSLTIATIALNPNQEMTDFDYKKYSLENLENWMHDAMSSGEATPQEIYDVIVGVVKENYYLYKQKASQADELLSLLNGNGGWTYEEVMKEKEYYEPSMPPWGHSDLEYSVHNPDKILSCDKDDQSPECKGAWNDFWESDPLKDNTHSKYWYEYDRNDSNRTNPFSSVELPPNQSYIGWQTMSESNFDQEFPPRKDKVVKWQLPVQVDGLTGDCYINFPDDLLEAANLKEGDTVKWIDRGDGSFELRKITKPLESDEC